jgi:hypothetical protein
LTHYSGEARHAIAGVAVDPIHARGTIETRIGCTLVDVRFAMRSGEARHAMTFVFVDLTLTRSAV